ncbi:MAG: Brp/Blh family beta-carotene 15,15'-dioxygenase [Erythrobacter sp.]
MSALAWLGWSAVLLVGVPHGASDGAMASETWGRHWGLAGKVLFVAAYLALAFVAYAAWIIFPAVTLAALLVMAMFHFGEAEHGWRRPLRGSFPIVLPALLWSAQLEALLVPLIGGMAAAAVEAAGLAAYAVLPLGAYMAMRHKAWRAEIAVNALFPPPFGFAIYFTLLHSLRELRRQARQRDTSLARHLAAFSPFALAAIVLLYVLALEGDYPWSMLLLGLLCLAVPHIAMPHVTRLVSPVRVDRQKVHRS